MSRLLVALSGHSHLRHRVLSVRRTPQPRSLGNSDCATRFPSTNRMPRTGKPCSAGIEIPSSRRAAIPSGMRPSPHALSTGGVARSAMLTRKPFWRAAIATASPAGPPPTMKTSVSMGGFSVEDRLESAQAARFFIAIFDANPLPTDARSDAWPLVCGPRFHQRSRINSEQKPGPMAPKMLYVPGAG